MHKAGTAVERVLNDDLQWMTDKARKDLFLSLLVMRRYEAEYRVEPHDLHAADVPAGECRVHEDARGMIAAETMKEDLSRQVKAYAETFGEWIASTERPGPLLAVIKSRPVRCFR